MSYEEATGRPFSFAVRQLYVPLRFLMVQGDSTPTLMEFVTQMES